MTFVVFIDVCVPLKLIPWCQFIIILGGDIWFYGKEGEGRVHFGADEIMFGQKRLHQNSDHQQESEHQIL